MQEIHFYQRPKIAHRLNNQKRNLSRSNNNLQIEKIHLKNEGDIK